MRYLLLAGCVVLLCASGCADMKISLESAGDISSADDATLAEDKRDLRIDVYPSSWSHPTLSAQSFTFSSDNWTGLELTLAEDVEISGVLTGFDVTRATSVSAPGFEGQRIDGRFVARLPGTVTDQSFEVLDGSMDYSVLPGGGYQLAWIPAPGLLLPFAVETGAALARGGDISMDLELGLPVYGVVTNESGHPMSGIQIRVVDPLTGFGGEPVSTDVDGRYQLRAFEGEYTLELSGGASTYYLPTLSVPLAVGPEGLEQDVQYTATESHNVTGQIFSSSGRPLQNVLVRFTARQLEERNEARLQVESETDANGLFTVRVVTGTYAIEYIPDYDSTSAPTEERDLLEVTDDLDLEPVELDDRVELSGRVLTGAGRPVGDALVQAQELGFDGYVYAAKTDSSGTFSMSVPDAPLRWTAIPPAQGYEEWAITLLDATPAELPGGEIVLVRGERIQGCLSFEEVPVTFTPIDVRDGSGALYITSTTNDQGCFDIRLDTEGWLGGDTGDGTSTGGTDGGSSGGGSTDGGAGTGGTDGGTGTGGTGTGGTDGGTGGTGGIDTGGTGTGTDTGDMTDTSDTDATGRDTGSPDTGSAALSGD